MSLVVAWIVFPLVLGLLSLGCGLLLDCVSGSRLPGTLVIPAGFALIVVAAGLTTLRDATAELTTPLVVALAVAGFGLAFPWRAASLERGAVAAAVAVFVVFAAPVVFSGKATFAGYIKLDDTATWLAFTDWVMEHGRAVHGLPPSTYEAVLSINLSGGYPLGSLFGLGVGHQLVGQDSAWLFQPYLTFLAGLLALAAWELLGPLVRTQWLRALAVFVGTQPALLYAYALWGGVKELVTACLLALLAALVPPFLRAPEPRRVLPLAVGTAALLSVLGLPGGVWLLAVFVAAAFSAVRLSRAQLAIAAAAFGAVSLVLTLGALTVARTFLQNIRSGGGLRSATDLGNLAEPLGTVHVFGIWPAGDFRFDPSDLQITYVLIAVAIAAGVLGLVVCVRNRVVGLPLFVASAAVGAVATVLVGSPWIDAKALAIASPAPLLAAAAGVGFFFERGRRVEAVVAGAAIAGGVLWSNALAYREVWLAPRDRLAELESIGERTQGQGPTLMTEYEPYGVRHFLRSADPEGASELRRRQVPLRNGSVLGKGAFADVDQFQLGALLTYRTLVLRRSPVASRPPTAFRLTWSGRYYEVWQRARGAKSIAAHLPLGSGGQATGQAPCGEIRRLAARVGPTGTLAAVRRQPAAIVPLAAGGAGLFPRKAFKATYAVRLPGAGRYGVWVEGEFRSRIDVAIDGSRVGAARHQLEPGQFTPLGTIGLRAGTHDIQLKYAGPDLHPGSGGRPWFGLGSLVLSRGTAPGRVVYVSAKSPGLLCGKLLDWVEALA